MTWWCSARDVAWSWSRQPYPGVWLFVLLLAGWYVWAVARPGAAAPGRPPLRPAEAASFGVGVALVWVAADWPLGTLGAGYLLSAHQIQYVLFTMAAPPLLVLGTPAWVLRRVLRRPAVRHVASVVTRPLPALAIFNVVVVSTHLPEVVDGLMGSQMGSFFLDLSWMVAGIVLWWPVLRRVPELNGLSYPGRFAYLLVATLPPMIPAAFLTFAEYPIYATYELAPPVAGISAGSDQLVGGLIMKFASDIIVLLALSILFFRWHATEERGSPILREGLADPQHR